ncbi:unnamed protein product [Acanthoscelides obtectus]|uniref:Gamma-interferon-inducible lysosomal thiol reductase n=1 Tax=Acanthoscelides obtectus TaxID=200917 RepID=A0A9P0KH58_ACAOB|nr:unnamed protein product [Acanthoscelides obtectus]CAK1680227.1 Gamma-interferon-inducible lysosomal thiol reductase [Acanthoscelides obtectus]
MKLVCSIILLSILSSSQAADKLKVSLYYESLCPGCRYFIQHQLYSVYTQFANYLELDMVPFGNAEFRKVGNKWQFDCQHGPKECYGNIIHACSLNSSTTTAALGFIACCEGQQDSTSDQTFQKCASRTGLNFKDLINCKETIGDDLLAANGEKSQKVGYGWVPFVTFNDKFDEAISNRATEDLKSVVCEYLANIPYACKMPTSANEISKGVSVCFA